jgi:hypothetical protein
MTMQEPALPVLDTREAPLPHRGARIFTLAPARGAVRSAAIYLHGRGAPAEDILSLHRVLGVDGMLGLAPETPRRARLEADVRKPAGLRCFYKARLRGDVGAVTAGQGIVKDPTTKKYVLADSNHATAALRVPDGIALNGGAANQPVKGQRSGDITIGAGPTIGIALAELRVYPRALAAAELVALSQPLLPAPQARECLYMRALLEPY